MKSKIIEIVKKSDLDGFTEMLLGNKKRYVIGLTHNTNPSNDLLFNQFQNFKDHFDNITIGGWKDKKTGIYYIDIGTTTNNLLTAKRLQAEFKQIAIFDLKEFREL